MVVQFRSEDNNALPTDAEDGHDTANTYITAHANNDNASTAANDSDFYCEGDGVTGSGTHRHNCFVRIVLPERPDAGTGDITNLTLRGFNQAYNAGTDTVDNLEFYRVQNVNWVHNQVTWINYKSGTAWETAGGDYDTSTDYASIGGGVIGEVGGLTTSQWFEADLSAFCIGDPRGNGKANWGSTLDLVMFMKCTSDGGGSQANTANFKFFARDYASTGEQYRPYVKIWFANPPPEPPFISVIPDEDGIDPKVQVDKHSTTPNLLRYSLGWKNVATNIEHGGSGVDMTDSDAAGLGSQPTIWPASKMSTTTLLDTEDSAYSVFVVAEHPHNQDTSGAKSNQVTISRPNVDTTSGASAHSGVITSSPTVAATKTVAVGEEITIRIKASNSVHSGKIKRFWINWEANISDTAEDYGQFNVDEHVDGDTTVLTKNFTHTYDRDEASNFTIKVQVEDEVGFRSNSTLIATITVSTPLPVAKLTKSRLTIIEADKADINNTVVVSGQHSYAVGSNRYIKGYKYQHNGGGGDAPLTAFPTANDNSVIYDSGTSERIALGCSLASCAANTFRVYGIYSVTDAGADIVDTDATFSHYVWGYETISPHATAVSGFTNGSHFFKHIEYAVCIAATIDAQDTGAYYSLVLRDDNTKIINNHLAVEKTSYKWGGYYGAVAISCAVTHTSKFDQASGTNYFASVLGLRAGDKVIVTGSPVAANNGTKTVASVTEDLLVVEETLVDDTAETITFERDTSHIVSVPVAAYGAQTNIITHDVVDDNAQTSVATSTQTIHVLSDNTMTYTLTTDVDAGDIAILNTTLSRSGGLTPVMTTGDRRYPLGLARTKLGLPTLTMNVRIMSNEGLRNMWSLVEGDRFAWVTLKKHLIDAPEPLLPYRTLRLKPISASLSKTPTDNKDYTASLTFVVMGEDI